MKYMTHFQLTFRAGLACLESGVSRDEIVLQKHVRNATIASSGDAGIVLADLTNAPDK